MGSLTIATRNSILDGLKLKTIKLHSGNPTDAGTALAVAGAQADFAVSAAANGAVQSTGSVEITVTVAGSNVTVSHYSLWDDNATTPKCLATGELAAAQVYASTGKYIVNTLTVDLNK
ncbi:hypothetical protein Arno18_78 [Pectobacterium phage Arno18]|jgi:hypothetical protein|uniref:Uncharacterized protein n=1 Tax=Pectobacterium phage Arno18 TaxID=2500578 RepID=A0A678ZK59_9CAUD|nr:hypothetical protein Arno18_78 [Pectobacterium phage Arno18]